MPTQIWVGLQNSSSTGKYLKSSGLDTWSDMGPANLDTMSTEAKTRMSDNASKADKIQGLPTLDNYLFGPRN